MADYIDVYVQQKNDLKRAFGVTAISLPGSPNVGYPRMTSSAAYQVIKYWADESAKLAEEKRGFSKPSWWEGLIPGASAIYRFFTATPTTAHTQQWDRAVVALDTRATAYAGEKNRPLTDAEAVDVWNNLDQVVIPFRAIATTPSRWELAKQALQETVPHPEDYAWIKYAVFVGIGLYVYNSLKGK